MKILIFMLMFVLSCGSSSDNHKKKSVVEIQKDIQNQFEKENFASAESLLKQLLNAEISDSLLMKTYSNLAFSQVKQDKLSSAYLNYNIANTVYTKNKNALAGLCLLEYVYKNNYAASEDLGEELLRIDSLYVYSLYPSLDYKDINLHISMAQFAQGKFNAAFENLENLYSLNFSKADIISLAEFIEAKSSELSNH